jgi:hypothetical protein
MLEISRSAEARQISQMSALWSSNCFAPIAANIDKYKRQLSNEEIALIETMTARYMQRYGYERATEGALDIEAAAYDRARRRSALAKDDAWRRLEATNFRDFVLRQHRAEYLHGVRERMERHAAARAAAGEAASVLDSASTRLDELDAPFEVTD